MFAQPNQVDEEVIEKIYTRLYEEADPGMDYAEAEKGDYEVPHYRLHYLDDDRSKEIVKEVLEDENVPKKYHGKVLAGILLGACPSGSRENVVKTRQELGLNGLD